MINGQADACSDIRRSVKFYPATTRMRVKESSFSLPFSLFLMCERVRGRTHSASPSVGRYMQPRRRGRGWPGFPRAPPLFAPRDMMGATEPSRLSFPHTAPRYFEGRNFRSLTTHRVEDAVLPQKSLQCINQSHFPFPVFFQEIVTYTISLKETRVGK